MTILEIYGLLSWLNFESFAVLHIDNTYYWIQIDDKYY